MRSLINSNSLKHEYYLFPKEKPLVSKGFSSLLHHAARRLLECNIVNVECEKCGKSTFWILLTETSLTGVYRFLWEGVSKMLAFDLYGVIPRYKF